MRPGIFRDVFLNLLRRVNVADELHHEHLALLIQEVVPGLRHRHVLREFDEVASCRGEL